MIEKCFQTFGLKKKKIKDRCKTKLLLERNNCHISKSCFTQAPICKNNISLQVLNFLHMWPPALRQMKKSYEIVSHHQFIHLTHLAQH